MCHQFKLYIIVLERLKIMGKTLFCCLCGCSKHLCHVKMISCFLGSSAKQDKASYSRPQCSDSSESRTSHPLIRSLTLHQHTHCIFCLHFNIKLFNKNEVHAPMRLASKKCYNPGPGLSMHHASMHHEADYC